MIGDDGQMNVIGIVLAGGMSSRMGRDKAEVELEGMTLLQRVTDRLAAQTTSVAINSNTSHSTVPASATAVFDDGLPGHLGPMAGILAGMRHAATCPGATHIVTAATDSPFFPENLVERLLLASKRRDGIPFARCGDDLHPVFALWPVTLADDLEEWLRTDGKRRVRAFIERHGMIEVDFPRIAIGPMSVDPFFNINTPADLEHARLWLSRMEATGS